MSPEVRQCLADRFGKLLFGQVVGSKIVPSNKIHEQGVRGQSAFTFFGESLGYFVHFSCLVSCLLADASTSTFVEESEAGWYAALNPEEKKARFRQIAAALKKNR